MFETSSTSIIAAISDPSNYEESSVDIKLGAIELPNFDDFDSATYHYELEWF